MPSPAAEATALEAYERSRDSAQYQAALSRQRAGDLAGAIETVQMLLARSPQHEAGQKLMGELQAQRSDAPALAQLAQAGTTGATGATVTSCSFDTPSETASGSLRFTTTNTDHQHRSVVADELLAPALNALAAGQSEQALQMLRELVPKRPNDPAVHRALGLAYYRLKDFQSAEASLRQALSLDNHHPLSYFLLGCTLTRLGQEEAAAPLYERAAQLDPKYRRAPVSR